MKTGIVKKGMYLLALCCLAVGISGRVNAAACTGQSWSAWTTTKATASGSLQVETKTQSRYRDRSTTTSTSSSLSGWTQYNSWTDYGSWGGWTGWQPGSKSSSDTVQVETGTVYGYYCFVCGNCGTHSHGWGNGACYTWIGGCGGYVDEGSFSVIWSTSPWSSSGDWHGTGKRYQYFDGKPWFNWSDGGNGNARAGYRYRTRSKTTTYYYEKWGSWSGWSDTAYSSGSNRQVETRTLYRSRPTAHSWNAGVVTKAATCGATGVKTYTCSACKGTKTEVIPKTGAHTPGFSERVNVRAATCRAAGSYDEVVRCTVCKTVLNKRTLTVPATGIHTWNGGVITTAATAAAEGVRTYTCTVCGTTRTEAVPRLALAEQKITAGNITLTKSSKKRTKAINVSVLGGAAVTYKLSDKKVKIKGNVLTIPAKYVGICKVTIKAAATQQYKSGSKTITLKVMPPSTVLKGIRENSFTQKYRISWKTVSGVSGYEAQAAQDKKFKKGVVKKKGKAAYADFSYKKGKTYYFRVRTYKKVNGKTVYSKWSKAGRKKAS